jgi:hypothetical protein
LPQLLLSSSQYGFSLISSLSAAFLEQALAEMEEARSAPMPSTDTMVMTNGTVTTNNAQGD